MDYFINDFLHDHYFSLLMTLCMILEVDGIISFKIVNRWVWNFFKVFLSFDLSIRKCCPIIYLIFLKKLKLLFIYDIPNCENMSICLLIFFIVVLKSLYKTKQSKCDNG